MKRYDIEDTGTPGNPYNEMIETVDGGWVKWEDVRRCFGVGVECNCAEMADNFLHHGSTQPTWICPAHGYKKL